MYWESGWDTKGRENKLIVKSIVLFIRLWMVLYRIHGVGVNKVSSWIVLGFGYWQAALTEEPLTCWMFAMGNGGENVPKSLPEVRDQDI